MTVSVISIASVVAPPVSTAISMVVTASATAPPIIVVVIIVIVVASVTIIGVLEAGHDLAIIVVVVIIVAVITIVVVIPLLCAPVLATRGSPRRRPRWGAGADDVGVEVGLSLAGLTFAVSVGSESSWESRARSSGAAQAPRRWIRVCPRHMRSRAPRTLRQPATSTTSRVAAFR
ncbi:MAG: hypothetical protein HZY75_07065 [Nocardioidaceae bacterium]|nr:MAG: hypothetical protein HZY75_07065 [Nocardioidaceae bacterium]